MLTNRDYMYKGIRGSFEHQPYHHLLRAPLLLPHLPPSAVANLLRVAPERFTTALLAQIFDAQGSQAGRRNLARAVCLLRNVTARRKAAVEEEEH